MRHNNEPPMCEDFDALAGVILRTPRLREEPRRRLLRELRGGLCDLSSTPVITRRAWRSNFITDCPAQGFIGLNLLQ